MAGLPGIWIKKIRKIGGSSFKGDFVIFVFFLILSFCFWYLNSLRKDFELDFRYPVKFTNPPAGREVVGDLPSKLTLSLRGSGYSIFKLKISANRSPLIIDFSKTTFKRVPDKVSDSYFIVSSELIPNFTRQLRSELQILVVRPDTIFLKLQGKTTLGAMENKGVKHSRN